MSYAKIFVRSFFKYHKIPSSYPNSRIRNSGKKEISLKRQERYVVFSASPAIYRLCICTLFFLFVFFFLSTGVHSSDEKMSYHKTYTSYEISCGDTLWEIAKVYAPAHMSLSAYITEVQKINHLENNCIHAGCYLILPVYKAE